MEKENTDYLFRALSNLGERKREEGESLLLNLASILEEIRLLTPRKKTLYEQESEEIMAEQRQARKSVQ